MMWRINEDNGDGGNGCNDMNVTSVWPDNRMSRAASHRALNV